MKVAPSDAPLNGEERRVLWSTSAGHGLTHLYMLIFPALITPLRTDLGLDLRQALDLSFPGFLLFGLGALPAGYITDRWKARWMLVICLCTAGLGCVLAGHSVSPLAVMTSLALVGLGASIYHPAAMSLLSRRFVGNRGRILGLNGVFGNLGIAVAPFLTGVLTSVWSWRWAFIVLGMAGIAAGVAGVFFPFEESTHPDDVPDPARDADGNNRVSKKPYFVLLCAAMTLGGLAYTGSSAILPTYFESYATFLLPLVESVRGVSLAGSRTLAATTLTSLVYLVGVVGQIIGGRVADRYDLRAGYLAFHLASVPALLAMAYVVEVPLFVAAFLYTLFGLGMQPIENSLVAKLTPVAWRSTAYGLKFILAFGVGAFAVGLVGRVQAAWGLPAVFLVIAGLVAGLAALAAILWGTSARVLPEVRN